MTNSPQGSNVLTQPHTAACSVSSSQWLSYPCRHSRQLRPNPFPGESTTLLSKGNANAWLPNERWPYTVSCRSLLQSFRLLDRPRLCRRLNPRCNMSKPTNFAGRSGQRGTHLHSRTRNNAHHENTSHTPPNSPPQPTFSATAAQDTSSIQCDSSVWSCSDTADFNSC
jgi:hypothetical protein